ALAQSAVPPTVIAKKQVATPTAMAPLTASPAGDASNGKKLFRQSCSGCHQVKSGSIAPTLIGVYGRKAGTAPGYKYSQGMVESGITWDAAKLDVFLAKPASFIKGARMPINVSKPSDRADVIAHLKTLK
ncbi:MAG: c-type cytochrome, partial [Pseudomonadota bacterium]